MAMAKTDDVKTRFFRYPGENLDLWVVLRGLFMLNSILGVFGGLLGKYSLGLVPIWSLVFILLSPYTNTVLKEKTGVVISRGLKIAILFVLILMAGKIMGTY